MSKYNDFMSHVRVDDEMHRRVMDAVSKALDEQDRSNEVNEANPVFKPLESKAEARPLNVPEPEKEDGKVQTPVRRKAKVSVLKIISIAAACIIVAGGAVYFASRSKKNNAAFSVKTASNGEQEMTVVPQIDAALGVEGNNRYVAANKKAADSNKTEDGEEATMAGEDHAVSGKGSEEAAAYEGNDGVSGAPADTENKNKNFYRNNGTSEAVDEAAGFESYLPFKPKTVGTSTFGKKNISATVYTGDKGEKMILFTAEEGTDIAKAYYPKFKGVPALLQTQGGLQFMAYDISVEKNARVGTTGPYDAVVWNSNGNTYMLAFGTKTDLDVFINLMERI